MNGKKVVIPSFSAVLFSLILLIAYFLIIAAGWFPSLQMGQRLPWFFGASLAVTLSIGLLAGTVLLSVIYAMAANRADRRDG